MNKKMRRILGVLVVIALIIGVGSIGTFFFIRAQKANQQRQLYEGAIALLKETGLNEDGTYDVSEELLIALSNAEYVKPKNFILMIGDGMGFNILKATEGVYADELYEDTLAMHYLPMQSSQCSYSVLNEVTDSAAGGTALSTGYKTTNSVVGMDWDVSKEYKTILELAAEKGKSTGIVATKDVTDATPASFTAHVTDRGNNTHIAKQQLTKITDGTLDLVLGGGRSNYEHSVNQDFFAEAKKSGMNYTTSFEDASQAKLPLVGLFADVNLATTDETQPTVAEMTDLALNLLSENEKGFFLMVEGSQIDSYGHANNIEGEMKEAYDFDCAVAVAMKYVAMNPDTVLIITADHETGGLHLPAEPSGDNVEQFTYSTTSHTGKNVPVLAVGYGVDALASINENVDIPMLIAQYMGEEEFGYKSTVYDVIDMAKKKEVSLICDANASNGDASFITTEKGKITVSYDEKHSNLVIPISKISPEVNDGDNIRAFHVTLKNMEETVCKAPLMKIICWGQEYVVEPQVDYLGAGEEMVLSYVFPEQCWLQSGIKDMKEWSLVVEDTLATYQVSSMQMTGRVMGK